jgi:DNA-binding response OmpR family regulator
MICYMTCVAVAAWDSFGSRDEINGFARFGFLSDTLYYRNRETGSERKQPLRLVILTRNGCPHGLEDGMSQKILIVEDEPALVDTLEYSLSRQGYRVSVATDGGKALEVARREQPDLIVLDVMLPTLDGFEVCRILRQEMSVPILMLTARADEVDKVVGLEVGADDYLAKPFSMRELIARVKAQLRRVRLVREEMENEEKSELEVGAVRPERLIFGELVIDMGRREMSVNRDVHHLKPKEFELLVFLARNKGMVLSRDLILERVWGWDYDGGSRTVDVHVRWLREKVEEDPSNPVRIVTVRGIGYRFEG